MAKQVMEYTEQELNQQRLLDALAEFGGKLTADEDVIFRGKQLILPETMNLEEAETFLREKRYQEEEEVAYSRTYNYRPWDGARATMAAMRKAFGAVNQKATPSFFGNRPPQLHTIPVSVTETEQVPWGRLAVVGMPGVTFNLGSSHDSDYGAVFALSAQGPKKFRHHIEGVFRLVAKELEENSLYRGKAFDGQDMPKFLDLSGISEDKVIYSQDTQEHLEANLWAYLKYSDTLAGLGIPLKRAVLLEGPFGTGKTLAAHLTAQIAIANGWSFIMCRPGQDDLATTMATAQLYPPAVVFFEDIDTVAEGGKDHISELLDIFDGLRSKGTRIMCVLTTNHVERIHKGLMRPGRLDAVIHIGALDATGIQRLLCSVTPEELLSPDIDWTQVCQALDGYGPSFCAEVGRKAVSYNVNRNKGVATMLETHDFVAAANLMQNHQELMDKAEENRKPKVPLNAALGDLIEEAVRPAVRETVVQRLDGAAIRDSDGDWMYSIDLNQ